MSTLLKVAAGIAGAAALTAVGVAGYRYYQRRETAKALGMQPGAGNIFTFLGENAKNVNDAFGRPPPEVPVVPAAGEQAQS